MIFLSAKADYLEFFQKFYRNSGLKKSRHTQLNFRVFIVYNIRRKLVKALALSSMQDWQLCCCLHEISQERVLKPIT